MARVESRAIFARGTLPKRHRKGIFCNNKRINYFRRSSVHRMRSVRDLFACGRDRLSSTILRRSRSLPVPADFFIVYKTQTTKKNRNFFGFKIMFDFSIVFKVTYLYSIKNRGNLKVVFSSNKLCDKKIRGISNVSKNDRQKND